LESVEQWAADSKDLVYAHWQELGMDLDLEIAPDVAKMRALEKLGVWKVLTAREDGRLVGYLLAVVSVHLHYMNSPRMFIVDAYYVSPESRNGTGTKLFRFAEAFAKELGTIKIYLSCKVHRDHSALFLALGYQLSDYAFIKRI
jgi:GNAT superfamily N-acetyltransferase